MHSLLDESITERDPIAKGLSLLIVRASWRSRSDAMPRQELRLGFAYSARGKSWR